MDDLKKKRIEKTEQIIDNVVDNMSSAIQQLDLMHLYERKIQIEKRLADPGDMNMITQRNLKLQLEEIEKSIKLIEDRGISLQDEYDIDVDEEAAKEFLEEHGIEVDFEFDYGED